MTNLEDSPLDQSFDDFDDEDDYDIADLIKDLEFDDSDTDYEDVELSDFDDEDDYTIDDLMKDLESDGDEELDFDFVEHEVLGDTDSVSLEKSNKYGTEDFVSYLESDNEFELRPISVEDDLDSDDEDDDTSVDESSLNSEEESSLKIQNESIKLDLWLKECVDQKYLDSFLKYYSIKVDIDNSPLSEIISTYELEDFIKFKYKSKLKEFTKSLKNLFLPLGVMQIVDMATKHDVSISLTKDGLINNFLKKYTVYEIIVILNDEGLNINDYLNISVLEQIYLLSDSKLEKISKSLLPNGPNSKYEMISSIVNQYSDDYLISDAIFKGDDL